MLLLFFFFFFNDTATTEIYTLSLHDALPISSTAGLLHSSNPDLARLARAGFFPLKITTPEGAGGKSAVFEARSEEHTSELQSRSDLVCRLLLEKKKKKKITKIR